MTTQLVYFSRGLTQAMADGIHDSLSMVVFISPCYLQKARETTSNIRRELELGTLFFYDFFGSCFVILTDTLSNSGKT
jgi:hypothetical protein